MTAKQVDQDWDEATVWPALMKGSKQPETLDLVGVYSNEITSTRTRQGQGLFIGTILVDGWALRYRCYFYKAWKSTEIRAVRYGRALR